LDKKEEILRLLYEHRDGLGHNELRERFNEKVLRRWLPELLKTKLVNVEKMKVKGGRKKLHFLTPKGIEYVERNIMCERFMKRFVEFVDAYQPNEKLEALGQLFKDMFAHSQTLLYSGDVNAMKIFRATIKEPLKKYVNRELLEAKETILEEGRGSGMEYCDPVFAIRRFSIGFIWEDGVMAWDSGHFLNTHHRYVFEKFGIHSKKEIEEKNVEWLQKHKDKTEVMQKGERLKELQTRIDIIKKMVEAEINRPLEKRTLPNWFFSLPKDYGEYLEDVT